MNKIMNESILVILHNRLITGSYMHHTIGYIQGNKKKIKGIRKYPPCIKTKDHVFHFKYGEVTPEYTLGSTYTHVIVVGGNITTSELTMLYPCLFRGMKVDDPREHIHMIPDDYSVYQKLLQDIL
jgi:hypothetical protein